MVLSKTERIIQRLHFNIKDLLKINYSLICLYLSRVLNVMNFFKLMRLFKNCLTTKG